VIKTIVSYFYVARNQGISFPYHELRYLEPTVANLEDGILAGNFTYSF
jgi:hypothetical protein